MGLVNLRDLVEQAAHRWYKDNEKDSMKARWGKAYNWKELVKSGFKDIDVSNRTIKGSLSYSSLEFNTEDKEEEESQYPDNIYTYSYVTQ